MGAEVSFLKKERDTIVLRQELNPNGFDLLDSYLQYSGL